MNRNQTKRENRGGFPPLFLFLKILLYVALICEFQCVLNELVYDFGIGQTAFLPKHWEHAELCSSRHSIDFIEEVLVCLFVEQEIHPGESGAVDALVGFYGALRDFFCKLFGKLGWDDQG